MILFTVGFLGLMWVALNIGAWSSADLQIKYAVVNRLSERQLAEAKAVRLAAFTLHAPLMMLALAYQRAKEGE